MVVSRIQNWLAEHPQALNVLFLLSVAAVEIGELTNKGGGAGFEGP